MDVSRNIDCWRLLCLQRPRDMSLHDIVIPRHERNTHCFSITRIYSSLSTTQLQMLLDPARLSNSGRPVLASPSEFELFLQDKVSRAC